jgi:hypothetical protein
MWCEACVYGEQHNWTILNVNRIYDVRSMLDTQTHCSFIHSECLHCLLFAQCWYLDKHGVISVRDMTYVSVFQFFISSVCLFLFRLVSLHSHTLRILRQRPTLTDIFGLRLHRFSYRTVCAVTFSAALY